jgi:hypothetical protein
LRRRIAGWRRQGGGRHFGAERGNGSEELAAVANRGHADADQIFGGELRQHLGVDVIIAERLLVLFEP